MVWNLAPECISLVVLSIIWVYSRKGNPIPNLKNRLFEASMFTTFGAMASNVLATWLIYTLNPYTLALTWAVNLFYFILTPLMGLVYCCYTISYVCEADRHIKYYFFFSSLPGAAYVLMILLNPFTRNVFDITLEQGYTQQKYIMITYVIFYFYCALSVFFALFKRKNTSRTIFTILLSFPIIAVVVILIQMVYPAIILSGSAATCAILLIYLYLQNKQLSIDHLTKVPNRQEFLKMLELNIKRGRPFTMIVISLRDFKTVNDIHGQHSGDMLLSAVSSFLRKQLPLREGELYRYSGDEFALVLNGDYALRTTQMVEAVFSRMAHPWEIPGCTCILNVALGVVHYPDTSARFEELVNGIECAVHVAKNDSANGYLCYCSPELLQQAKRRQTIVELMKTNLNTDGFEVFYQPILRVKTGKFALAEALLRMNNTPLGNIYPSEFIPIAEESGLIVNITYLVLEKVCRFVRALLDEGVELEGISVNFSAIQFTQKDLLPRVREIIERCRVPYTKIIIEITESTLAENPEVVMEFINQVHSLGIRIGLDDFGTGYSNFSSVIELPIDTIKLDKSLIWAAVENSRFAILLQNLARAFYELDTPMLAEGVETEAQRDLVLRCNCSLIQGFLYARPMPEQAFRDFIVS